MVCYHTLLAIICAISYPFVAAANEISPIEVKEKHILEVNYHPLPVDSMYTAPCRFHSYESTIGSTAEGIFEKKAGAKRGVDDECSEEENSPSKDTSKDFKSRLKMRFDHTWDIFVGWVDNAKSDSEFLVEIGVGTPAQTFLASIDTGSPLTWIYSKDCCFQSNHSFFKPEDSSSYSIRKLNSNGQPISEKGKSNDEAQRYTIEYGSKNSSSLSMTLAFETITVFPGSKDSLQVPYQTFGLLTSIANAHRGQGRDLRRNDALLGLSPGNGTKVPGKLLTPIEQLIKSDSIAQPLFTVTFVKALEPLKKGYGGRFIIGGFDEERTIGEINWINSTSSVFWGFDFDQAAMKYNNKDVWNVRNKRRAIVDTGSSAVYLPKSAAQAINSQIYGAIFDKNASRWLIPCKTGLSQYEDLIPESNQKTQLFTIKISNRTFGLPLRGIVLYPLVPVSKLSAGGKDDYCNSAIQIGSEEFAVLGNAFIKEHCVTFDYGGPDFKKYRRIGIAYRRDTGIIVDSNGLIVEPINLFPPHLT